VTLLNNNTIWVVFEEKQKVIPGQSIVFYNEDLVIGGGIIETATSPNTTKLSAKN
jgi:tRNA-specific 2-thiouridylase